MESNEKPIIPKELISKKFILTTILISSIISAVLASSFTYLLVQSKSTDKQQLISASVLTTTVVPTTALLTTTQDTPTLIPTTSTAKIYTDTDNWSVNYPLGWNYKKELTGEQSNSNKNDLVDFYPMNNPTSIIKITDTSIGSYLISSYDDCVQESSKTNGGVAAGHSFLVMPKLTTINNYNVCYYTESEVGADLPYDLKVYIFKNYKTNHFVNVSYGDSEKANNFAYIEVFQSMLNSLVVN